MMPFVRYAILLFVSLHILNPVPASAQSLLWRLDVPGVESPSWVFGTMHARCAKDIRFSDALLEAINSTDVLALELDLDDPALPGGIAKYAFMPRDSSLRVLLSPGEYDTLSSYLRDSVSMAIPNVESMRPLFLIGLLIGKVLGCTPVAYEDRLMAVAKAKGKEIIGIETVEEQFHAFASIPLREQARMVLDMIRGMEKTREAFRRLDDAYARADLDTLLTLAKESDSDYGRYDDALLSERNHRWIPRLMELAGQRPTLFAVGAGHLPGDDGILTLLRAAGCTVTAVTEAR
jgi:uncharacterized protein